MGAAGRVGLRNGGKVVSMLGNQAFAVETENVEGHLLACTSEVVHGLQEDLVAIFESADVVHGGLHRSGSEVLDRADESVAAGAVCEVVLDVARVK